MGRLPRNGLEPGRIVPAKFGRREFQELLDLQKALGAKSRSAAIRVAVAYALGAADGSRRVRDELAELAELDGT